MSICAFILNPVDEIEESLNIPVASEEFFSRVWNKGCQELELNWIPIFSSGIDILKEDLTSIIIELEKLKKWSENNLLKKDMEKINNRIDNLETELPKMFKRKDAIIFIG